MLGRRIFSDPKALSSRTRFMLLINVPPQIINPVWGVLISGAPSKVVLGDLLEVSGKRRNWVALQVCLEVAER